MTGTIRKIPALGLAVFLALCGCGGTSDQPSVVVYVSADRAVAIPVLDAFTRRTGIEVRPLFDTEATKTTGLANRIRRERQRPKADVFWSSEPFAVEQLASEGLLSPATNPELADHPAAWKRPDDRWFAFGGRARVIAFDPERVPIEARPRFWSDLVDPRWKGSIAMADPRFGTTRGHVGAVAAAGSLGPRGMAFEDWIEGLERNGVVLMPGGNAATVDAVVRGEVLLGLTDSDDVLAVRRRGVRLGALAPRHRENGVVGGGTMLIPNAAGMVAGSRNSKAANELIAFLASAEVERMLNESPSGNIPVAHPEVLDRNHDTTAGIGAPDPWLVSIPDVAAGMDEAVDVAMETLVRGGDS
ncbi:MAG: extracellular solute-binding protein [Phycisphaera sp.]|nr:extracellular solute-binding protein [Phycisphaera sp.]